MPRPPGIHASTPPTAFRPWTVIVFAILALASTAIAAGPARLMVLQDDELGKYLTDDLGRALYVFVDPTHENDLGSKANRPTPSCDTSCRAVWPPLVTDGDPVAVPSISADLVGIVDTPDGAQVSFDGWPLYRFAGDRSRADHNGEGIEPPGPQAFGGAWYLIAPDGSLIEADEATTSTESGTQTPTDNTGKSGSGGRPGYY